MTYVITFIANDYEEVFLMADEKGLVEGFSSLPELIDFIKCYNFAQSSAGYYGVWSLMGYVKVKFVVKPNLIQCVDFPIPLMVVSSRYGVSYGIPLNAVGTRFLRGSGSKLLDPLLQMSRKQLMESLCG